MAKVLLYRRARNGMTRDTVALYIPDTREAAVSLEHYFWHFLYFYVCIWVKGKVNHDYGGFRVRITI